MTMMKDRISSSFWWKWKTFMKYPIHLRINERHQFFFVRKTDFFFTKDMFFFLHERQIFLHRKTSSGSLIFSFIRKLTCEFKLSRKTWIFIEKDLIFDFTEKELGWLLWQFFLFHCRLSILDSTQQSV